MEDNKVKQLFAGLQSNLRTSLGLSAIHGDPNAKGDNSEISWRKMLTNNLPSRYKVDAGFVIDCNGAVSDSIDIIIYDSFYSTYVFNDNGVMYVPVESVYAVIECKQSLDKGHVEYSANKAASVKKLERTSLPISQMNGELVAKVDKGFISGVLTTSSAWKPPFGDPLKSALFEYSGVAHLDIGCCLEDGAFTTKYTDSSVELEISQPEEALVSFYINLITKLQQLGNAPAIDLSKYYKTSQQ